jgi:hypothetical protein
MKRYFSCLFMLIFFAACRNQTASDQSQLKDSVGTKDSAVSAADVSVNADSFDLDDSAGDLDSTNMASEYQTFYLVTITEGNNYDSLLKVAQSAAKSLNLKVDLMNRRYDPEKGIVVNDDDEDEMYRGEYYPRRSSGNFVSIEMKDAFIENEKNHMRMLVISNIFGNASQADSVLSIAKSDFPSARAVKADLFMGCMH